MSEQDVGQAPSWRRPMGPRDPRQDHRQATFLELFFDLCFVVAVAHAASQLHHAMGEGHATVGVVGYLTVFFAIWWAWMNFTWLSSAYDNDDVPFRLATLIQMTGALILAAGVERAFREGTFDLIFYGYAVMRAGLVALWLRAAVHDPERRATTRRYATGVSVAMVGWSIMLVSGHWPLWGWWFMAGVELAVPVWAERAGRTPWHPGHIAERYGLFTIIVLGESVLAATIAVQAAIGGGGAGPGVEGPVVRITAGGLLLLFSLWWLYFARPAERFLTSSRVAFVWGYGHYIILAATAAVGAGLALNIDHATGHAALSDVGAGATLTVPVAVYLVALWILHLRPSATGQTGALLFPAAAGAILAATFGPSPVLVAGLLCVGLVVATGVTATGDGLRTPTAPAGTAPSPPARRAR